MPSSGTYNFDVILSNKICSILKEHYFISNEILDIVGWTSFSVSHFRLVVSNITSVCDRTNI